MTNIKKIALGLVGMVAIVTLYYITTGATQLTTQMKAQVSTELATLQTQGFAVAERKVSEKKEHFVLSMDDPQKVTAFFAAQGAKVSKQDILALQGLTLGVDVSYLPNSYSAASFDIYPLTLPTSLRSAQMSEADKQALQQIETLLKKKTFLLHVELNKLGTGFKGYMKDINEVIATPKDPKQALTFVMNDFKFNGDIKTNTLSHMKQSMKMLSLHDAQNNMQMQLDNMHGEYRLTGTHKYDYNTHYNIENIVLGSQNLFALRINNLSGDSSSKVKNKLVDVDAQMDIQSIHFDKGEQKNRFETIIFDMKANHLDMLAIEKLENIDPNNEKEILHTMNALISHGIHFEIPNFSIKRIMYKNQQLDGFKVTSTLDIDKNLDILTLKRNPMTAVNAMDAALHLSLSNQLFGLLAQQPQAMLAMMLFQPKDVNGQKVYNLELKDAKLTVNGKKVM